MVDITQLIFHRQFPVGIDYPTMRRTHQLYAGGKRSKKASR